ncbi:hypothetical protein OH687_08995 [Burkholderia anthina]|nr:hypothetical protein OH687_08995 [Burkholderia anthina]
MLIAATADMRPQNKRSDASTVLARTRRLKRYFVDLSL